MSLSRVDENYLTDDRRVDLDKLRVAYPDCNLFGIKMIADSIAIEPRAATLRMLPRQDNVRVNSFYHLHQINIGGDEPLTLHATHANSVQAGNAQWAVAWGSEKNTTGLQRGRGGLQTK